MNQMNNMLNQTNNNMNNNNNMMEQAQIVQNQNNMNMNLLNQNQNQVQNFPSSSNSEFITVVFRTNENEKTNTIKIQCKRTELVSEIIERYRNKTGDHDKTKKFIFNASSIDDKLTVGQAGLVDGSAIFVVITHGVKGA